MVEIGCNSGILGVVGVGRWLLGPIVLGTCRSYFYHKEHKGCTKDTKPNDT